MQSENSVIDYKSVKKITSGDAGLKDLAISCVGLANTKGGKLIIGIEDKTLAPPPNQRISDSQMNSAITRLRSLCYNVGLILEGKIVHDNGGEYFSILVQAATKSLATTSDGKLYVRVGDQCQPARGEEILRLAAEKDAFQWELNSRNIGLEDISNDRIAWFVNAIRASDRVKDSVKEMDDVSLLQHYNLIYHNHLTNLGVLWLGTTAMRSRLVYPITVQYLVYDEQENKIRKEEWNDYRLNPQELISEIESKAIELTYFDEFPDGIFRKKIPHYDPRLVRELLINAIVHKSFGISGDIFIKVFTDRLEITNPGGLPMGITPNNILHTTNRRNPHLIRIFHDLKLMEGEGSGYDLIYEITGRDAKEPPIIQSDYNSITVIQYSKIIDKEILQLIDFINNHYTITQRETIVLGIIARHKKILSTQLSKELQLVEESRLRSYVAKLIDHNIIISRGIKKGTEYLINPKLIASAKINIKPTLKTIEPHRLEALIIEDLIQYPKSKSSDIQKRMVELPIEEIRKALLSMVKSGKIETEGIKKSKCYLVAKKN